MKSKRESHHIAMNKKIEALFIIFCIENVEHSETGTEKKPQTHRLDSPGEASLFFVSVPVTLGNLIPLKCNVPSL